MARGTTLPTSAASSSRSGFAARHVRPACRRGFTLVELLVVIGIIVMLIGILLPVVRSVQIAGYNTSSAQQIQRIMAAIQAYKQDHRADPGPYSNNEIINPIGGEKSSNQTMSENLVLGLIGGLAPMPPATPDEVAWKYDEALVRSRVGPRSINPNDPKVYRPYLQVADAELSLRSDLQEDKKDDGYLTFRSHQGGPRAHDTGMGEFVDHFPDPLPVLYLRARPGAPGVISNGGKPAAYQYDLKQISYYTGENASTTGPGGASAKTGIGGHPTSVGHGLQQLGQARPIQSVPAPAAPWGMGGSGAPPYDAITYFLHAQLNSPSASNATLNATGIPREKDGFILISPGKDRIYGTRDDITNFGSVE
jgi:prepilin-type N-terminal cleavage/methylation domain-containing protein